jgi:hypothetical protein
MAITIRFVQWVWKPVTARAGKVVMTFSTSMPILFLCGVSKRTGRSKTDRPTGSVVANAGQPYKNSYPIARGQLMAKVAKRRGRYVLDFYDHQGKRRWKTMPKGTTKKKAEEELRKLNDQLLKGIFVPAKRIPLFKRVAADWLIYKKPNLRQSTWSAYEGHTKKTFQ